MYIAAREKMIAQLKSNLGMAEKEVSKKCTQIIDDIQLAAIEEHYRMLNQTDKTLNKKNLTNFKSKFDLLRTEFLKKEYSVESKNKKGFTNVPKLFLLTIS